MNKDIKQSLLFGAAVATGMALYQADRNYADWRGWVKGVVLVLIATVGSYLLSLYGHKVTLAKPPACQRI